jgi:hypothetical protein
MCRRLRTICCCSGADVLVFFFRSLKPLVNYHRICRVLSQSGGLDCAQIRPKTCFVVDFLKDHWFKIRKTVCLFWSAGAIRRASRATIADLFQLLLRVSDFLKKHERGFFRKYSVQLSLSTVSMRGVSASSFRYGRTSPNFAYPSLVKGCP